MGFGNLGLSELLVLAVLVLVFFGPRRIPEVARSVGQTLREFKRGMNEIRRELEDVERSVSGEGDERAGTASGSRPRRRPGEARGSWDEEGDDPGDAARPRGRVQPGRWEEEPPAAGDEEGGGTAREAGAGPDAGAGGGHAGREEGAGADGTEDADGPDGEPDPAP